MLRNRKFVWRKFGPSRARWNKNALVMESWVSTTCVLNSVSCVKTSYSSTSQSQSVWTCVQAFPNFPFSPLQTTSIMWWCKNYYCIISLNNSYGSGHALIRRLIGGFFWHSKKHVTAGNFTKLRCKQNESIMELCPILSQAKAIPTSILMYV